MCQCWLTCWHSASQLAHSVHSPTIHLGSHFCPQGLVSSRAPQGVPLLVGGLIRALVLFCSPKPQGCEQSPHGFHSANIQSVRQGPLSQGLNWSKGGQGSPAPRGALTISLTLRWAPKPHRTSHGLHSDHSEARQSTAVGKRRQNKC